MVGHTMDVLALFISVILIDSSTRSPVHVLMLSIQAVRGLPRLTATEIVTKAFTDISMQEDRHSAGYVQ